VYLNDTPIAVLKTAGAYMIQADHLNTPRTILGAANALVWKWDSDAFGTTTANENPSALGTFNYNPRFPGQNYDKESTGHYNYFRDLYFAKTGRYLQSDPIGLLGGINTYAYVGGNPISSIDPLGLMGSRGNIAAHQPGQCGSDWNEPLVPDNPLGCKFSNSCKAHDQCYDDSKGPSKSNCDQNFRNSMRKQCENLPRGQRSQCNSIADMYYNAVDKYGQSSFDVGRGKK
jgi:RHS repeat-associated protein